MLHLEQTKRKGYYALKAWFRNGNEFPLPIHFHGTKCDDFKLKDLPSIVDYILYKYNTDVLPMGEKLAAHREQFIIEFFLPIQLLLNEPVEQWKLPSSVGGMLGVDYKLVVRFCDFIPMKRIRTDSWLSELQCLCLKYPNVSSDPKKLGVNWLEQFDPTKQEHAEDLRVLLHDDGKLFVILLFSPDKKVFPQLLHLGIPFLFWTRHWDDSEKECFRQKFNQLLEDCGTLDKLPEVLLKKRRGAAADCRTNGTSMICNLSLLWNKHDEVLSFLMRSKLTAPDS